VRRSGGWKALRVVLALAAFVGVNLFLLGFAGGCGWLAKAQLLPALLAGNAVAAAAVAALTLVCGRVYCSVLCPLGVLQDGLARLLPRRRAAARDAFAAPRWGLRIAVLVASVAAGLLGAVALAALFDGYSLYGRFATHLLKPLAQEVNNFAAWVCVQQGHACVFREEVFVRGVCGLVVAVAGLVLLAGCVWAGGRVFCNTLCPTGTLLACLSKRPLLRIRIDADACVKCGLCARACKAHCIDVRGGAVDDARCVRCFNCLGACGKGAIRWTKG